MKTKIIMTVIALALTLDAVLAVQIYSTEILNDGTTIKKCRYNNGKIDYCTQQDALKAIEVFNNPVKYMTKEQKAKWDKAEQEFKTRQAKEKALLEKKENLKNSTIPTSIAIGKSIKDIRQQISRLGAREDAGIDVSAEMQLLDYKYEKLFSIPDYSTEFDKAYSALSDGVITQSEFDSIIAKLKEKDMANQKIYNEIVNTTLDTLAKKQAKDMINPINIFETSNNSNNVYEQTKVEKINNGLNNGVNMLNNTMNNVRVIKGLFGKY